VTDRPRFVADAMLGRLAKSLRMLGYDVVYRPDIKDRDIRLVAVRDGRVILTRDREVAATSLPVDVVLVDCDDPREQLRRLVADRGLEIDEGLFTRCLICNCPVEGIDRGDVEGAVPPYVFATQDRFVRCPNCGRIYWPATHVARARAWLASVLGKREVLGAEGDEAEREDGN